ncbi:MAG TPA: hypothetical protein VNF99_18900 [Stellaceae bacterium]|nr:hypothetical protein [Stellaceae bacterium]
MAGIDDAWGRIIRTFPSVFAALLLLAQSDPGRSADWTQTPGSNRFGVGLNGLGGTHATPLYAAPNDATGWGITTMKPETPSAPTPLATPRQESQAPEPADGLGNLLPPLDR